jgi:hypothetical protein
MSDPFALEELHRKLSTRNVAAFEAVATSGTGVLQTLTTISKRVIRHFRERDTGAPAEASPGKTEAEPARPKPSPPPGASQVLESVVFSPAAPEPPLDEGLDRTAAVDPATLYDESHPDTAGIEATAAAAEALFEPSFRRVTVEMGVPTEAVPEGATPVPTGGIQLESVGEARQTGPRSLRIPIALRDEAGRTVSLSLAVELEPDAMESGD